MSTIKISSRGAPTSGGLKPASTSSAKPSFRDLLAKKRQPEAKSADVAAAEAQAEEALATELARSVLNSPPPAQLEKEETDDRGEGW